MSTKGPQTKRWSDLEPHEKFALLCALTSDLQQARQAIDLSEQFGSDDDYVGDLRQRLLFGCLAEAAVVRYARAFALCNLSDGKSRAKINADEFTVDFDAREKMNHEMFLSLRDSTVAHSDHGVRSFMILRLLGDEVATRGTSYWPHTEELLVAISMITKVNNIAIPQMKRFARDDELVHRSGVQIAADIDQFRMGIQRLPFAHFFRKS
jgi:hypothetical protein